MAKYCSFNDSDCVIESIKADFGCVEYCGGLYADVEYEAVDEFGAIMRIIKLAAKGKNDLY